VSLKGKRDSSKMSNNKKTAFLYPTAEWCGAGPPNRFLLAAIGPSL